MTHATAAEPLKVLVPFTAAEDIAGLQDIFVYLRPETNGMLTESSLFGVLRGSPVYSAHTRMAYLANIPGGFLVENRIIEDHYRHKISFARQGKALFTPGMIEGFEEHFGEGFEGADVLGAYQFIEKTGMDEEELFRLWVDRDDFLVLHGQTIKHWAGRYIINYDIPALLHKNSKETDIAVFLLRSCLSSGDFKAMIDDMEASLRAAGVLEDGMPPSRAFHYSKGPFEQLLDARGFLYRPDGSHVPLEELCFHRFLVSRGLNGPEILELLNNPIRILNLPSGGETEGNLFSFTAGMGFAEAFASVNGNTMLPHTFFK